MLCKFIYLSFLAHCSFGCFPLPLPPSCLSCQSDSRSADCCWIKCQATLGKQVLRQFQDCLSKLDRRRQSDYPRVGLGERLEAVLSYVLCFESLAIFHANAHSTLLLPTVQSLCELRLLTGDGLGVYTLLVRLQEAFHSARRQVPGPTCRARCQTAQKGVTYSQS